MGFFGGYCEGALKFYSHFVEGVAELFRGGFNVGFCALSGFGAAFWAEISVIRNLLATVRAINHFFSPIVCMPHRNLSFTKLDSSLYVGAAVLRLHKNAIGGGCFLGL